MMELVRIGRRIERAEAALSAAREAGDTWAIIYCRRDWPSPHLQGVDRMRTEHEANTLAESELRRLNLSRRLHLDSVIGELEIHLASGNGDSWTREDLSRARAQQCDLIREANERGWQ